MCRVEDCGRKTESGKSMCASHRKMKPKDRGVVEIRPYRRQGTGSCDVDKCAKSRYSRGMCEKHSRMSRDFGISATEISRITLVAECAICLHPNDGESFHIDHDHSCCPTPGRSCGKCVRGAICERCNLGIGMFSDNVESLRRAILYINDSKLAMFH